MPSSVVECNKITTLRMFADLAMSYPDNLSWFVDYGDPAYSNMGKSPLGLFDFKLI